jgi:hypothetical protein
VLIKGILDIAGNPNCSINDERFLILVYTLSAVGVMAIGLLALPPIGMPLALLLVMGFAVSFALGQAFEHLENIQCGDES